MRDLGNVNEISKELSEKILAYIELKKDLRIVTHNQIDQEKHKDRPVVTKKLKLEYSETDINLEKKIFDELIEYYKQGGEIIGNSKLVIYDISVTTIIVDPHNLKGIRGILIMYSYIYK